MPARFAPAVVERAARVGGGFILRSPTPLPAVARCLGDFVVRWASEDRLFLAERAGEGWRRITYRDALARVRSLGQLLLDRGLGATRPLAILSGNSIDHALLALAAMHVGVPVAPISTAYSLQSKDHGKLRMLGAVLGAGAVWADSDAYAPAIAALGVPRLELAAPAATAAVDRAFAAITPDTVAKILFTSGSTGVPKGVVNTHRMLCANQAALAAGWSFLADRPPVLVDWLPWSHTFGGNHNFNLVLAHGGAMYIDAGKPAPGAFSETLRNLREVAGTLYFNVPRGFDMLVDALERDAELRRTMFRELDLVFYAAAALSPATWARLVALAPDVPLVSAWGSTETSPLATQVHFAIDRAGVIGLPVPGHELAFAPVGDKHELRVRGPSVTPGYWRAGGAIEPAPQDELGFYPMGDAGVLADHARPDRGVIFDGRTAENFKLSSGTWVHVGAVRISLVAACSPDVADAVICGHDREEVGALLFAAPGRVIDRAAIADALARTGTTSSTQVRRALVLDEPPAIDAGEITDKGYLNQRAILDRRAADVAALYAGDPRVIVASPARTRSP